MATKVIDANNMVVEVYDGPASALNDSNTDGTGVTTTDTTLTDPTKTWTVDQWIGTVVLCFAKTMTVTSNTVDTLTGVAWSGGGNPGPDNAWYMGSIVQTASLIDTRGFTPSGASNYWAGATLYMGLSTAAITESGATSLAFSGGWVGPPPDNGREYKIIRDRGSQYRYANQIYNTRTSDNVEVLFWTMPTLNLPDSVNGAVAFIRADITATAAGTGITIDPTVARWHKEGTFKWMHTGWQANAASFTDVGLSRTYKEAASAGWDASLRLHASSFYPAIYVTGAVSPSLTDFQATIDFTVYSIV